MFGTTGGDEKITKYYYWIVEGTQFGLTLVCIPLKVELVPLTLAHTFSTFLELFRRSMH